jgi:hypothetical protein
MAATVELIDPRKVQKNPDNPRLIFQSQELNALEESIREQGILVPLTVFRVRKEINRFIATPKTTINQVFERTVEQADFSHATEQLVNRSLARLRDRCSRLAWAPARVGRNSESVFRHSCSTIGAIRSR